MWYYADLEKQKCYHMKDFPDLPDFDNQEKACSIWRRFAKYVTTIKTTLKKQKRLSDNFTKLLVAFVTNIITNFYFLNNYFQFVRDIAVAVLGQFRYGRSDVVWSNWNKKLHQILGASYVRFLLRHKRHRVTEHAYCHDV